MDNFKGDAFINLQPGAANVPIALRLPAASASTKNDGAIPYGSTVASVAMSAKLMETGTASTSLVTGSALSGNGVIAYLSHTTTLSDGLYGITATVTFSLTGSTAVAVREFDLNRVYVRNL